MTISLHNSDGRGLFDRVGSLGGGVLDLHSILGGTATTNVASGANMVTRANTLEGYYAASPANRKTIEGIYQAVASWQQAQLGFLTQLQTFARNTLVDMANVDVPLPQKTVAAAMVLLIQQMVAASASVNASAPAAGTQTALTGVTPTGNPAIVVAVKRPSGLLAEYAFPETLVFTCTGDTGTGSTAYREPFSMLAPAAAASSMAFDWPLGSGASQSLSAVDASVNATSGSNLLNNSDFEDFTSNIPDNWSLLVGTAGTDVIAAGSSDAYASSAHALQYAYNSGSLPSVAQTFGSGTSITLKPNRVYLLNYFAKRSSGLTGNGTISVDLVDGSNTLLTDDAGNNCAVTKTAASLGTTYGKVSGAIVTPKSLPSTVKLRVRLSVAIADSGKSVFLDNLALTEGVELYTGGPFAAVFSGDTKPIKGDAWTVAVTNTWGAFQELFERFFGMRALGLQLPSDSAGAETVLDSYIA